METRGAQRGQGGEDGRQALKTGRVGGGGGGGSAAACSSECSRAHLAGWGPGRQARGSGGGVGSASSAQLAPLDVSPHGIVSLGTAPRLIPSLLLFKPRSLWGPATGCMYCNYSYNTTRAQWGLPYTG